MAHEEIVGRINSLPLFERIEIVEELLNLVKIEVGLARKSRRSASVRAQMSAAATSLVEDYRSDLELTAFKVLDGEDVHASG